MRHIKKVPKEYKFRWLFESDGSSVADFIESNYFVNNNHSIDHIISSYFRDGKSIGLNARSMLIATIV